MMMPSMRESYRRLQEVDKGGESWGSMLEDSVRQYSENVAVKSAEATLTYREYNEAVNRCANHFRSQGLKKGDVAILFLENRPELLIAYSAMAKLGVVNAMINTNLRRESLLHCMSLNPGRIFFIGEELLGAFEEIRTRLGLESCQKVYWVPDGQGRAVPEGYVDLSAAVRGGESSNPPTTRDVGPLDPLAYVFTSGTTGGMPKAAVVPHGRTVRSMLFNGRIVLDMGPRDTMYVPLPFFHTNALALSWPCVFAGGAALAIRRKFSASRFWDDVRQYRATAWCYVGELCRYLMNQPPNPDDSPNLLRKIIGNGLRPDIWKPFKRRFGVSKVYEIYGAAESNIYFINLFNLDCTIGTSFAPCAIVRYDVDADAPVRGEDGFMQRVEAGETGLVIGEISGTNPIVGYTDSRATEAKVFRDVFRKGDAWFNSGDLLRDMGYGHAQFVDRLGDTFRWKGENVSTTEVEKTANTFPQVSLSAVYGVLMPGGDGRVGMAAIVPRGDSLTLDLEGLAQHFRRCLPSYAVPAFLRLRVDFDYTPTHKIRKKELREEGFDPGRIADPLYVLFPGASTYTVLTGELHREILKGAHRF
jgi:citronellyl-CoA synthetase